MVNYANISDRLVFRLVICNNQTRPEDMEAFFEALVAIARAHTATPTRSAKDLKIVNCEMVIVN